MVTSERQDILAELNGLVASIADDTESENIDVAYGFAMGMFRAYRRCAMISPETDEAMTGLALKAWQQARLAKENPAPDS